MAATLPHLRGNRRRRVKGGDALGEPVAVVGGRPDGDEGVVEHRLVALHDQLVGPGDEVQLVVLVELAGGRRQRRPGPLGGSTAPLGYPFDDHLLLHMAATYLLWGGRGSGGTTEKEEKTNEIVKPLTVPVDSDLFWLIVWGEERGGESKTEGERADTTVEVNFGQGGVQGTSLSWGTPPPLTQGDLKIGVKK